VWSSLIGVRARGWSGKGQRQVPRRDASKVQRRGLAQSAEGWCGQGTRREGDKG